MAHIAIFRLRWSLPSVAALRRPLSAAVPALFASTPLVNPSISSASAVQIVPDDLPLVYAVGYPQFETGGLPLCCWSNELDAAVIDKFDASPSLIHLSLSNTELLEDTMLTLDKLPHLQVLKLRQNSYSGRKLSCVCSCGFPELKVLHLKSMYWLEDWMIGAGAMPKLGSLIGNPCAYLRKLPEELWRIKSFCKLELHWPQPVLRQNLRAFEEMEQQYDIQLTLANAGLIVLVSNSHGHCCRETKKPLYFNKSTAIAYCSLLENVKKVNYEADMARVLIQLIREHFDEDEIPSRYRQLLHLENVKRTDIWELLKDINYFVDESEKAIDTFFINITQQQCSESESTTCIALLVGIHSKIIDIRNRLQQIPPRENGFDFKERRNEFTHLLIEGQFQFDKSEFESGREELFDLLIEGQPRLSVVAILDSSGFDKTAFAADTYNNNHVKFYFDCHAWVRVSIAYDFRMILDDIIKSVMPPSRVSVVIGEDYQLKKSILRDYLTNKKYFIVLDDYCEESDDVLDDLEEVLPENQNGSRVLITVTDSGFLCSFELENGEPILPDSVLVGGPLIRLKHESWQFFILYYGKTTLRIYTGEKAFLTTWSRMYSVLELSAHLKICCLYLCVFHPGIEISTRQLYQLWVAEGFIPYNSEETAEHYLNELIDRGFIQVNKRRAGGTIKACYVPTFAYAALVGTAAMMGFVRTPDFEEESLANTKRYIIFDDPIEFFSLKHSDMYLQSFLNHSSESDHLNPIDCENFCKMFKHLRVLNMGSIVLDQYPPGLDNLFHLKYLKLNIPSLKCLPSPLCTLSNLQTLDMPSSYVDHVRKKQAPRSQSATTTPVRSRSVTTTLVRSRTVTNDLPALHPSSCTPDILCRLPNLQTLRVSGDLSCYHSGVSKSVCELHKVECLKLVNESKLSRMVLSKYQFPPSLMQLSLSNTELMEDPMPMLEKLPRLQVLKLKQNSYLGRKLAYVGSGGFPVLKILHLKSMYWLDEWTMGAGAMPKLESLIVNPCAYLRKLPEELWCIKSLRKLDLHWPQTELRQRLRTFEDMEWRYDIQLYPYGI
ncbi:putative disease resistance RPP8-like protein 2 [Citrus sinensis]|uniref:Disease resistance RPP8-like protein 2 n=1 Tax=Citrus sinensis TaxID=2711 RepID=A0ACB8KA20_CITSI|nr:putative disease resistance RPP8-like protein 2 [Citrus sinensis]